MSNDEGYLELLHELLEPLGSIRMRKMFGGHGVYCEGLFIAIVIDGQLYLKVDELTRPAFVAAGCEPFIYTSKGRSAPMSYWNVPEEALDSAEQIQPWAQRAIAAALRKPAAKASRRRK
ncbi:MAG: TfoX/Sxy family protein [Xanthomonadaceae bacterium]|nr:TfoX/Sxy family protein [Xanthomonadaceae bacterium]MDZ4115470.1 TfoX/Sxy family protein [Xanthomonadaceae bacterium]MDZ4376949.1 TfoX/Sxy family protein [Xanthomonadaceae bacterium]